MGCVTCVAPLNIHVCLPVEPSLEIMPTCKHHCYIVLSVVIVSNALVFSEVFIACIGTVCFSVQSQGAVHNREIGRFAVDGFLASLVHHLVPLNCDWCARIGRCTAVKLEPVFLRQINWYES